MGTGSSLESLYRFVAGVFRVIFVAYRGTNNVEVPVWVSWRLFLYMGYWVVNYLGAWLATWQVLFMSAGGVGWQRLRVLVPKNIQKSSPVGLSTSSLAWSTALPRVASVQTASLGKHFCEA